MTHKYTAIHTIISADYFALSRAHWVHTCCPIAPSINCAGLNVCTYSEQKPFFKFYFIGVSPKLLPRQQNAVVKQRTRTHSRTHEHAHQVITESMKATMAALKEKCVVGIVGGSDFVKINEQLAGEALKMGDFTFGENGLTAYKGETELESQSFLTFLGEDNLKRIVNWTLKYIANLDIPQKRGTFIEFRNGMLNISPIGRNCSRSVTTLSRNHFGFFC